MRAIEQFQIRKIYAIGNALGIKASGNEDELHVQLGDRFCAVIKKEFGADAIAKNPFAWITFEQGNNLIEILKRYVASARKRGEA